jgi:hypothetical protein
MASSSSAARDAMPDPVTADPLHMHGNQQEREKQVLPDYDDGK